MPGQSIIDCQLIMNINVNNNNYADEEDIKEEDLIIQATATAAIRDRKGGLTQNCLAICGFDMVFYYMFSGWEGSAADSTMFHDAHFTDLPIPPG